MDVTGVGGIKTQIVKSNDIKETVNITDLFLLYKAIL